jgi:hypothetical protein
MKLFRSFGYLLVGSTLVFGTACSDDDDDDDNNDVEVSYEVELAGDNMVPVVATPASGTMSVSLDGLQLELSGSFEGLTSDLLSIGGTPAHVHVGPPSGTGPVLFDVDVDADADMRAGTFTLSQTLTQDQRLMFEQGTLFLNIHTEAYPNGELRGQLVEGAPTFANVAQSYEAILVPEDHVHDVDSNARGWATVVLRDDNTFLVSGAFEGLTSNLVEVEGSAVNLHDAPQGQTGPVLYGLTVNPGLDDRSGTFSLNTTLSTSQRESLEQGELYLNLYSADFEEGELRGQILTNGQDITPNNDIGPPVQ